MKNAFMQPKAWKYQPDTVIAWLHKLWKSWRQHASGAGGAAKGGYHLADTEICSFSPSAIAPRSV